MLLSGVALTAVDRPLLLLGGLAVAGVVRAGRALWRVHRHGLAAALPAPPEPLEPAPRTELDRHDRFLVAQRFRLVGDRYELSLLAEDGRSAGAELAVVDRPAFTAKERLDALGPGPKRLFAVRALQVLDVAGRYRVDDGGGRRIGELRKSFAGSLLRSTWEVWDGAGTLVATAQERSVPVALLRRAIGLVPVLGEVLALGPIRYHFDVHAASDGARIATLTRVRSVRDRYALEVDGDPQAVVDRRLALALAVALDAFQAR